MLCKQRIDDLKDALLFGARQSPHVLKSSLKLRLRAALCAAVLCGHAEHLLDRDAEHGGELRHEMGGQAQRLAFVERHAACGNADGIGKLRLRKACGLAQRREAFAVFSRGSGCRSASHSASIIQVEILVRLIWHGHGDTN